MRRDYPKAIYNKLFNGRSGITIASMTHIMESTSGATFSIDGVES